MLGNIVPVCDHCLDTRKEQTQSNIEPFTKQILEYEGLEYFYVKVAFESTHPEIDNELLWVKVKKKDVDLDRKIFKGRISNEPLYIDLHLGSKVEVKFDDVIDFLM